MSIEKYSPFEIKEFLLDGLTQSDISDDNIFKVTHKRYITSSIAPPQIQLQLHHSTSYHPHVSIPFGESMQEQMGFRAHGIAVMYICFVLNIYTARFEISISLDMAKLISSFLFRDLESSPLLRNDINDVKDRYPTLLWSQ